MKAAMTWLTLRSRSSRRVAALLSLSLFFFLQTLAASDALHQYFHADAAAPDHHCAVTLLAQGQVNAPAAAPVLIAFIAAFLFSLPLVTAVARASFDYRFSASRAPPRF
jgi:hypothetical protein